MEPLVVIAVLLVAAVALAAAELVLPTGGVLGVLSAVSAAGAIGACFWVDRWLGVGVFAAAVVAAPFAATWGLGLWQRSPIGRRVVLGETAGAPVNAGPSDVVGVGEVGRAVSALRPMGECEFPARAGDGGERLVQCLSELGPIAAGTAVRVIAYRDGLATVRAAT